MTKHLGSLGTPRAAGVDMDFDYFGVTIRVHPHASDLGYAEWMHHASKVDMANVNEVEVLRELYTFMEGLIHPEDWQLFRETARANHQLVADLMLTSRSIVEAVARFPTGQSSVSSGKRGKKSKKSTDGSSSPAGPGSNAGTVHSVDNLRTMDPRRAMRLLGEHRPDLQIVVADRAWEADRAAQAG